MRHLFIPAPTGGRQEDGFGGQLPRSDLVRETTFPPLLMFASISSVAPITTAFPLATLSPSLSLAALFFIIHSLPPPRSVLTFVWLGLRLLGLCARTPAVGGLHSRVGCLVCAYCAFLFFSGLFSLFLSFFSCCFSFSLRPSSAAPRYRSHAHYSPAI